MADPDPAPTPPVPPAAPPLAAGQIEIWKKIVDVQQHFNDLELRIRNFALVVTGAFLGLGGYAIKDGGAFELCGRSVSIAGVVVLTAIFPLIAFYFMDRFWYHRLLDGSVKAGVEAETALKDLGYSVDLGSKISKHSPFTIWFTQIKVHSAAKMDIFYAILAVSLLVIAAFLGVGIHPQPTAGIAGATTGGPAVDTPSNAPITAVPSNSPAPALPALQPAVTAVPSNTATPLIRDVQVRK